MSDVLIPADPTKAAGVSRNSRWSLASRVPWARTPLFEALVSAILVWFAFPPVNAWWLAWVAPIGWIRLVSVPAGRVTSSWLRLYGVGLLHWLLMIQWIRLPHWSAYFGWLALAIYLAVYLPLFVSISRSLVHDWRWPSMVAVPVVWTGLELARSHLLTGFSMSLLGHTQLPWLAIVQVADLGGAYGVSFLIMAVAAGVERMIPRAGRKRGLVLPMAVSAGLLAASLAYGHYRLQQWGSPSGNLRSLRVALIQGSLDTQFDGDAERPRRAFYDYARLSQEAVEAHGAVDLVVWPESMFTANQPMMTYDEPLELIPEWEGTVTTLRQRMDAYAESVRDRAAWVGQLVKAPLLVGLEWAHWKAGHEQRYNSAVLFDPQGKVLQRYDKMHRVMFGEYVPLGNLFPWLYRLTPMRDGLTPGDQPCVMEVAGVRLVPTICFENTVPHLVRRQCVDLAAGGSSPDVLVTVTNDGWFWGSSLLDVHLACGVFRAVEMRRPMVIAANTGFSAWIDATGEVRDKGPRRAEGFLLADLEVPERRSESPYYRGGDLGAGICLFVCGWVWLRPWVIGLFRFLGRRPRYVSRISPLGKV